MKSEKNKQIDEIIGSLDNIQKAAAPNYFYTRLQARMENELLSKRPKSLVLRPAYILSVLLLVLVINAVAILKGSSTESATADSDTMQSIAAEYKINSNLTYEINQ